MVGQNQICQVPLFKNVTCFTWIWNVLFGSRRQGSVVVLPSLCFVFLIWCQMHGRCAVRWATTHKSLALGQRISSSSDLLLVLHPPELWSHKPGKCLEPLCFLVRVSLPLMEFLITQKRHLGTDLNGKYWKEQNLSWRIMYCVFFFSFTKEKAIHFAKFSQVTWNMQKVS